MLLPSALPCDIRPQKRNVLSPRTLSPPPPDSLSPNSSIFATCRNLHSRLQSPFPSTEPTTPPNNRSYRPRLSSPINFNSRPTIGTHHPNKKEHKMNKTSAPKTPTRLQRKRRRALSDDMGPSVDQENISASKPSTPKRQRICPPSLPLGLDQSDFEALATPSTMPTTPFQLQPTTTFTTPSRPLPFNLSNLPTTPPNNQRSLAEDDDDDEDINMPWRTPDDSALVATILNKLRLRQTDWDECAKKLGKGKDSIGERWKMLVGEEEVGLRRSRGISQQRRRGLQGMEFGPEISSLRKKDAGI